MSHRLKRWGPFWRDSSTACVFLCQRNTLFFEHTLQLYARKHQPLKLWPRALCYETNMLCEGQKNYLHHFQHSDAVNCCSESSLVGHLQLLLKLSQTSRRSVTPPCYVSSQDMSKNSLFLFVTLRAQSSGFYFQSCTQLLLNCTKPPSASSFHLIQFQRFKDSIAMPLLSSSEKC